MKGHNKKKDNDKRKSTATKLLLYTSFVIIVSIFAISSRNDSSAYESIDNNQEENNVQEKEPGLNEIIQIPNKYNYTTSIIINEQSYKYTGTKEDNKEVISKEVDGVINNYIYENYSYYKEYNEGYILTTKEEIYDIVDYNYLNLKTINQYLSKSIKEENQYIIYLKDIILGNDDEEYIVINIINNIIDIDYTSLMKKIDKTIDKYYVKIEIEEIE